MSAFRAYPKIHRLGKEETDNILNSKVTVQEKVDGANISIWLGDDNLVHCGSRTRELQEGFNGFVDAVGSNHRLLQYLTDHPTHRLYGEWLVKHTISYPETAYKKIYLYDIYDAEEEKYMFQPSVKEVAEELGLEYPQIFIRDRIVTEDQIKEVVGKSFIGPVGEGVVIKNPSFINKFGDHTYAKLVTEKFKESNAIAFGGNNKNSETYWEMYLVNKYCTLARVEKIMQKLQAETDRRLDMEHTSRIAQSCYHDMITEEAWDIAKKIPVLQFKKLSSLATRKFIQIYHDILNDTIGVADASAGN